MLQTLKSMANRYNSYMTHVGRKRACEVLLRSSDRMLEDAGFSRELLQKGPAAWPWQFVESNKQSQPLQMDKASVAKAVTELESYSDRDLHDLGITRGTITESIVKGRAGDERRDSRKAA